MAPLSRFLSTYHVTHAAVLLGYPLFGSALLKRAFPDTADNLWTWEKQIAATTVAVLSMKFLRRDSLDAWIGETIRYAEASLLALSYVADPHLRVFIWGLLFSLLSYAFLVPPRYISEYDVRNDSCRQATPATFHAEVKKTEWTKHDRDVAYVVFLHADWSPASNDAMPVFFDVAEKFATPKQKFLTLDVGRFPEIAEKTLGVPLDASGPTSAVPSALLFEKGEEVARVPRAYLEGAKVKGSRMRGMDIIKGLGIDERFERTGGSLGKRPEAKKKD
jgi:thiol-disulfide isomerase/thioredoxin